MVHYSILRRWLNSILIRLMFSQLVFDWSISGWSFRIPYNYVHIRLNCWLLRILDLLPGALLLCDSSLMVPTVTLALKSKSQISRIWLGFTKLESTKQLHGSNPDSMPIILNDMLIEVEFRNYSFMKTDSGQLKNPV